MTKTPIDEIIIIGNNLSNSGLNEFVNREGVLCIGDGKSDVTLDLINEKLQGVTFADNLRIDISAHGGRNEQKQHRIFGTKTESFLENLQDILIQNSGKQELVAEWHLWSCYGGSSNKAAHILGKNNSLITHIDSRNTALSKLENYTMNMSIENYLTNPKKDIYTRWVEEQKYAFQSSTFNFNPTSNLGDAVHLKNARTLKPEILKDIVKKFKYTNDLTAILTDFIAENIRKIENSEEFKKAKDQGYFKFNFKDSEEVKFEVSDEEAKILALGIAIYLSGLTKEQNLDIFKEYISGIQKNGVDIGDTKIFDLSPLLSATIKGNQRVVEALLNRGADVNMSDKTGKTPLVIAAQNGYKEIIAMLIEKGAELDKTTNNGITPLLIATQNGHKEAVAILIKGGAKLDKATTKGSTPLYIAAQNGHVEVAETLLTRGADLNKAANNGLTPLDIATQQGYNEELFADEYIKVVEKLLEYGANTALNSIEYLKKITDINTPAKDGSTLLLRAIKNNQIDSRSAKNT